MKRNMQVLLVPFVLLTIIMSFVSVGFASGILHPGDLIVSTYSYASNSQIFWSVDPVSGEKVELAQSAIGANNDGMAITNQGRLFVAQDQNFRVVEIDLDNGAYTTVAANGLAGTYFGNIRDMAAADDGSLWVLDNVNVSRINPDTGVQSPRYAANNNALHLSDPFGLAVEPGGALIKTYAGSLANNDGAVVRINPATGAEQVVATLGNPMDIIGDPNGNFYAIDEVYAPDWTITENVCRIDGTTGATSLLTTVPGGISELGLSPGYGLYAIDNYKTIWKIDTVTGQTTVLTTFTDPYVIGVTCYTAPEPSTLTLLGMGAFALSVVWRWKKQKGDRRI